MPMRMTIITNGEPRNVFIKFLSLLALKARNGTIPLWVLRRFYFLRLWRRRKTIIALLGVGGVHEMATVGS